MPGETGQKPQSSVVTTENSSNRLLKIGLVILGIILLFLVGEGTYYFLSQGERQTPNPTPTDAATPKQDRPLALTSPTPGVTPVPKTYNIPKAQDFLSYFESQESKQDYFEAANILAIVSGEVTQVGQTTFEQDGQQVSRFQIILEKEGSNETFDFLLETPEVQNAKVYLLAPDNSSEDGTINDIEVGDQLTVRFTLNLLNPTPFYEYTFEVRKP